MPLERGRGWSAAPVVLLLMFTPLLSSPVASSSSQGSQACTEVGGGPVIRDTGPAYLTVGSGNGTGQALYYTTTHDGPSVISRNGLFEMWMRIDVNTSNGIYRAVSRDGIDWNISSSPALSPGPAGSWDNAQVLYPDVVWNGTGYLMYYMGDGGNTSVFRQIGVAFSPDGLAWKKYAGNPIITHGPGVYDARYTRAPSVIFDDGTYKMWYTGSPALSQIGTVGYFYAIAYATSPDGVHWTKYPSNPVFLGFKEYGMTSAGWSSVVKVNGTYLMAFSDGGKNLGYAISRDGVSWAFSNSSNVLLGPQSWHNNTLNEPSLLLQGSRLLLWYNGAQGGSNASAPFDEGIGFATCGILVAPNQAVTTSISEVTFTERVVSTSISTSIATVTSVQSVTVVSNPNASFFEVATAFAIGAAIALAGAVTMIMLRLRAKRR